MRTRKAVECVRVVLASLVVVLVPVGAGILMYSFILGFIEDGIPAAAFRVGLGIFLAGGALAVVWGLVGVRSSPRE